MNNAITLHTATAIRRFVIALLLCLVQAAGIVVWGQEVVPRAALKRSHQVADSLAQKAAAQVPDSVDFVRLPMGEGRYIPPRVDSLRIVSGDSLRSVLLAADSIATADSIAADNTRKMLEMTAAPEVDEQPVPTDSLQKAVDVKQWIPDPAKATWMALVIPGGGQIYNRKFWKLPIFYGGFAGCAYALTWNNKMYNDYSDAYRAAVNEEWDSSSITDLLPPGYTGSISHSQLTETLRRRKDTYRRYRDLSIFAFIGVYLLSVVDAYVDAELSNFDITPDLSMKVEPAVIDNNNSVGTQYSPLTRSKSVGLQCSFRF